jgi:hypothetical protein
VEDTSDHSDKQSSSLLGRFRKHHQRAMSGAYLMPTSCSWFSHNESSSDFVVAFQEPCLQVYDASSGKEKGLIQFEVDPSKLI